MKVIFATAMLLGALAIAATLPGIEIREKSAAACDPVSGRNC